VTRQFTYILVIVAGLSIILSRRKLASLNLRGYKSVERWFGPRSIDDQARTYGILGSLLVLAGLAALLGFFR